jgi:hypothetical protein
MKLRPGILLVVALFMIMGLSSCVHEYICQCTIVYEGQPGLPDTLIKEYNISDTKKKAKNKCQANSSDAEKDGIKTKETCDLY